VPLSLPRLHESRSYFFLWVLPIVVVSKSFRRGSHRNPSCSLELGFTSMFPSQPSLCFFLYFLFNDLSMTKHTTFASSYFCDRVSFSLIPNVCFDADFFFCRSSDKSFIASLFWLLVSLIGRFELLAPPLKMFAPSPPYSECRTFRFK